MDSNIRSPLLETDSETFTRLWQQNCFGAFLFGKQAIATMKTRQQGTLIFTGATASLGAKLPFTAFATAKAGLRALTQGMAREFAPQGTHVVHTITKNSEYSQNLVPECFTPTKFFAGIIFCVFLYLFHVKTSM